MNTRELIIRRLFVKRITEDNDSFVAALQYVSNKNKNRHTFERSIRTIQSN